ncbi:MAG: DUF2510 domain-containing protein [Acidimicrobiia bacterium]|nr:DUF2510 domain-containing protein [Acidimicrobiia bacterium]
MALAEHQRTMDVADAGWYPDPDQEHQLRYFDGTAWTAHVTHNGPSPCNGCCDPLTD